ncbi:hypothetical protein M514_04843 [Trichuris suis]|uniref:Uncharacterized protein n=1 Tax=Trichuris suis TaxID=68888 RepID=A0A085MAQ5_9BILA|nr:hypothetical protein M513_04843 [Trichuris suis]KFD73145.1 hypothetical protein M514_04843 [Trichuris suis]
MDARKRRNGQLQINYKIRGAFLWTMCAPTIERTNNRNCQNGFSTEEATILKWSNAKRMDEVRLTKVEIKPDRKLQEDNRAQLGSIDSSSKAKRRSLSSIEQRVDSIRFLRIKIYVREDLFISHLENHRF